MFVSANREIAADRSTPRRPSLPAPVCDLRARVTEDAGEGSRDGRVWPVTLALLLPGRAPTTPRSSGLCGGQASQGRRRPLRSTGHTHVARRPNPISGARRRMARTARSDRPERVFIRRRRHSLGGRIGSGQRGAPCSLAAAGAAPPGLADREAILRALDDPPRGLAASRGPLLPEHTRSREQLWTHAVDS